MYHLKPPFYIPIWLQVACLALSPPPLFYCQILTLFFEEYWVKRMFLASFGTFSVMLPVALEVPFFIAEILAKKGGASHKTYGT